MTMKIRTVALFAFLALSLVNLRAKTILVNPGMSITEIETLLHSALPGDTVRFTEGSYRGPFVLEQLHGLPNQPVVITGENKQTVIDGATQAGMGLKNSAFSLENCSWINIEDFTIQNCWTDLIRAENTSWLSLIDCRLYGGKRALFATGRKSHHFLIQGCTWEQDARVWTHEGDYSWDEIHHGIHKHFNGSLFQGSEISGGFVLRDNHILNTFNAFRLSPINDGIFDPLACTNGEIYRNTIFNTSDNVLEPEVHVLNLHFYHNTMVNGHAFISITEVQGGELYVYGNTAMSMPESDDGWTIFKISCGRDSLTLPFYIFNNSWQVDFDMIGSPRNLWENSHIRHFNNACYSESSDTFGIYNIGLDNHFDYDCSNVPFPALLLSVGHEEHGIVADPLFRDPLAIDFRLKEASPCIDAGKRDDGLILSYEGEGPDIGAWEGEKRVEGPAFRFMDPGVDLPYRELPRITRVKVDGNRLKLWFSMPMDEASLRDAAFRIGDGSVEFDLETLSLSDDGYLLMLSAEELSTLKTSDRGALKLQLRQWPVGRNGMTMTTWASEIEVERKASALDVTRSIANKIIRETSFEYEMVPMTYNGGITRFTLDKAEDEQAVYYARGRMKADEESDGLLGLSFSGQILVLLNGEEIFKGSSELAKVEEYTYNRYRFTEKLAVKWLQGENTLLVKCATGKSATKVLMLPVNDIDEKDLQVEALPVGSATPNTHWLTIGPWKSASGNTMETTFPPELGLADHYTMGDEYLAWQLEEVPLLRKLVVPESNSYTRDPYADWHYANGGTMLAILSLYEATGDELYMDFVKRFAANIIDNDDYFRWQYFTLNAMRGSLHRINRMSMLDDSGGPALPFAELQRLNPKDEAYGPILERNFDYVMNKQERLDDLTFSRPEPEPATVWADDLFMMVPFLLRMAEINDDASLYDEVVRQVIRFHTYLSDASTQLYFHGWYNGKQENTPVRWGRANGWIVWATSEALLHMPEKHPGYKKILKIYREHMEAIAGMQDASGMWHQVLDHASTWEESSCTAMFTLGMARGARMGWLKKEYGEQAQKAWVALQAKISADGRVADICRGTGIGGDVEFYAERKRFDHDPRGLGAMITAGIEISLLEK